MAKITEDYVSFETAKLLKEKGFKEMCDSLYGLAYMHNGKYIDEDEEYELESEGRGSEIELVEGGMVYNFWYRNDKRVKHQYSRPTLQRAMKWLRKKHKCIVTVVPDFFPNNEVKYRYFVIKLGSDNPAGIPSDYYTKYENACDDGIKYSLNNLI